MIASLKGVLASAGDDGLVIEVGGVGYLVFCSGQTLAALPRPGEAVALKIETHVREDHIHLYGFVSTAERDWFRHLITVQGVGARVALAILSVLSPADLAAAVAAGDKTALGRASGVGPKLAQRIVTELKDRVAGLEFAGAAAAGDTDGGKGAAGGLDPAVADAVSALANLGYGRAEAFTAVMEASRDLGGAPELEALIRAGLLRLGAAA
ncbi:MAG: Holliday junction branch migration protein RuvA [Alphaproteobacteria bacterium]|nr:Holliday junction branch migration protein RuvA [Alphaproteobacteria bacterium]